MKLTIQQKVELIRLSYGGQRLSAQRTVEAYMAKHPGEDIPFNE